jgi:hypothetical protein
VIDRAKTLLYCIGDVEDGFLDETLIAQVAPIVPMAGGARKKLILFGALGLAASFGILMAYKKFRPRRA